MSRPRLPNIERTTRWCESCEQNTEHSVYDSAKTWTCMVCAARKGRERFAGGYRRPTPASVVLEPTESRSCDICFIELGSAEGVDSGVCRECGEY